MRVLAKQQPSFEAGYRDPLWKPAPAVEAELTPELPTTPLIVPPARNWHAFTKKLTVAAWDHLFTLAPETDEQKQRKSAAVAAFEDFVQQFETLFRDVHEAKVERLTGVHSTAAEACRKQLAAVDATKLAVADYQATLRTVNAKLGRARADLFAWGAYEPDLNNFPTAEQVAIWKKGKELRQAEVEKAELAQGDVFAEDRRLRSVVMKELGKLAPLTARELELRNELSGDEFFDAEFGLKHVPEV